MFAASKIGLMGLPSGRRSLMARAISAIRRNNGTLYMVPDDFGLTLGQEDSTGPWLNSWSTPFDTFTSTGPTGFTAGTAGAKTGVRIGVSCGRTLTPGLTYRISFVPTALTNVSVSSINGATNILSGTSTGVISPVLTAGQRHTSTLTIAAGNPTTHVMFVLNTTGAATFAISEFTCREVTSANTFIDSTGTQPVSTVGDVLGLLTDRSYGTSNLGLELVAAPLNLTPVWTATGATITGTNSFSTTSAGGVYFPLAPNKSYRVTTAGTTTGGAQIGVLQPGMSTTLVPNSFGASCIIQTTTTQTFLYVRNQVAGVTNIDNISVREVLGNHATQPTPANRPVLSARVNQFTETEFRNGLADAQSRAGLVTASSLPGYLGALAIGYDGTTLTYAYKTNYQVPANVTHTISAVVRMDDGLPPSLTGAFDASTRDFVLVVGGFAAVGSEVVKNLGDGLYRVTASRSVSTANASCGIAKYASHSSRTFRVTAFDIRPTNSGSNLPEYQRVNTSTDYNTVGFPYYMLFDGTNDSLSTTITTGNEGWVCAGVTFGGAAGNNETVFASGAGSATQRGVWLLRNGGGRPENTLRMGIGNGTAVTTTVVDSLSLRGVPRVVDGGWTASTVFAGVDGTVSSQARTGDATPAPQSALIGSFSPTLNFMNGPMSALVYTPVLPSEADRALIRRWIGSLQGQTL